MSISRFAIHSVIFVKSWLHSLKGENTDFLCSGEELQKDHSVQLQKIWTMTTNYLPSGGLQAAAIASCFRSRVNEGSLMSSGSTAEGVGLKVAGVSIIWWVAIQDGWVARLTLCGRPTEYYFCLCKVFVDITYDGVRIYIAHISCWKGKNMWVSRGGSSNRLCIPQ